MSYFIKVTFIFLTMSLVHAGEVPVPFEPTSEFAEFHSLYDGQILSFRRLYSMTRDGDINHQTFNEIVNNCQNVAKKNEELNSLNPNDFDVIEKKQIKRQKKELEKFNNFCNGLERPLYKEN